jgi:hypothetical protein
MGYWCENEFPCTHEQLFYVLSKHFACKNDQQVYGDANKVSTPALLFYSEPSGPVVGSFEIGSGHNFTITKNGQMPYVNWRAILMHLVGYGFCTFDTVMKGGETIRENLLRNDERFKLGELR